MIITKKAIVGFILLAFIVFFTTDYTVTHMWGPPTNENALTGHELMTPNVLHHEPTSYMKYNPPILSLGKNAPIAATAIIELFTFACYLVLKKYEPSINEFFTDRITEYKENQSDTIK